MIESKKEEVNNTFKVIFASCISDCKMSANGKLNILLIHF